MWRLSFALALRHGASKVLSAVYRYGAPPTLSALSALLDVDAKEQEWKTYVADVGCILVKLWSKNAKIRPYSEMTGKYRNANDSRSSQDIIDDMIARRKKKRAARGGDR